MILRRSPGYSRGALSPNTKVRSKNKHGRNRRRVLSVERKDRVSVPHFPTTRASLLPSPSHLPSRVYLEHRCLYRHLLPFLSLKDISHLSLTCHSLHSPSLQKEYRDHLRSILITGIQCVRRNYWLHQTHTSLSKSDTAYYHSIRLSSTPFTKAITQDAARTLGFETSLPLSTCSQQRLCRVLTALALHRKELGYCQGINYLVAVLLQVLSEEEAFWVFNALCENYDFDLVFVTGMYRVRCVCNAVNHYTRLYLPALAHRLDTAEVHAELYAARWVLTLFARELKLPLLLRLWDLFLLDGWKVVVRLTLAVMEHSQEVILRVPVECTFEECLKAARAPSLDLQTLHCAYQFKVTRRALSSLDSCFITDLHTESTLNQCGLVQTLRSVT